MTKQETEVPATVITWSLLRFFTWIWSGCQNLASWFYSSSEEYPPDEAGELMRRHVANRSWFDEISYAWSNQTFFSKIMYISFFTLSAGVIGSFIGSSLIWSLSAVILSMITHKLLVSHEANRLKAGRIIAADSIELSTNLRVTQDLLNAAVREMHSAHDALKLNSGAMREQAETLGIEIQSLQKQDEALLTVVQQVEEETASLLHQENDVTAEFAAISADLDAYHRVINDSRDKVKTIGDAASQFSDAVEAMQNSQMRLSEAVDTICFFAREKPRVKMPDLKVNDDLIAAIMREDKEDDAFIAELMRGNSPGHSVH